MYYILLHPHNSTGYIASVHVLERSCVKLTYQEFLKTRSKTLQDFEVVFCIRWNCTGGVVLDYYEYCIQYTEQTQHTST